MQLGLQRQNRGEVLAIIAAGACLIVPSAAGAQTTMPGKDPDAMRPADCSSDERETDAVRQEWNRFLDDMIHRAYGKRPDDLSKIKNGESGLTTSQLLAYRRDIVANQCKVVPAF